MACTNRNPERGRHFAEQYGIAFVSSVAGLCSDSRIDLVDVCNFPEFRLEPVPLCARSGKHVLVDKPMATSLDAARHMLTVAR